MLNPLQISSEPSEALTSKDYTEGVSDEMYIGFNKT